MGVEMYSIEILESTRQIRFRIYSSADSSAVIAPPSRIRLGKSTGRKAVAPATVTSSVPATSILNEG
jgi:hypothetical protein